MILFQEHSTSKLLGTGNWGAATIMGILAGVLYGGSKEAAASVVSCFFAHLREMKSLSLLPHFLVSFLACLPLEFKLLLLHTDT